MARLAGKFAGILQVAVPDERAEALVADLTALKDIGLLVAARADRRAGRARGRCGSNLELLGADHPGIVAEISASLAGRGIGIEELTTDLREAPMAGGMLFEARAVLEAPPDDEHGRRCARCWRPSPTS